MILDRIKIDSIDESISNRGGRTMEVRVSSSSTFTSPLRPISTGEIRAKSFLAYRGILNAPIAALPMPITGEAYDKFLKNNGMVKNIKTELESLAISTSPLVKFPILKMKAIRYDEEFPLKIAFSMQSDMDSLDYLSMPNISCNPSAYSKSVTNWCETSIDDYEKGCVPQLSMKEDVDVLDEKLDVLSSLANSGLITIVNLIYANPNQYPIQYAKLWKKRNNLNFLINCSDVPMKGTVIREGVMASDMESTLTTYGIDSITREKRRLPPKAAARLRMEKPPNTLSEVDAFDWAIRNASVMLNHHYWNRVNDASPLQLFSVQR